MGLRNETRVFGGVTVTVMEFDAWRGFQLLPRLGNVLGALAPGSDGKMDMGKAIPGLCAAVVTDPDLLLALLESTTCTLDGKVFPINDKAALNVAFSGQLWALAETLGLVMEVSFNDFLSRALSAVESLGPAQEESQESPESA